jgi:hypothetical protein
MNKLLFPALAVAMISGAWTAPAVANDLGISINIGEPGFYGRLDIGDFPQPQLIYAQPMIIERDEGYGSRQPVYLRVPPGHERHWRSYCHQYSACGQPVYFVRDSWYQHTYAPQYREHHHGHGQDETSGNGRDKHHGNKHDHDEKHD